ncbi:PQQ-dependent sugar dehydrogenase [Sphingomonas sp. URHD0057]|uniref:PQQ-dependent sugar dehydrogenase n=1 Tax=Sphingomonas sp. URHD0057 TaxID=1380389 RepID=UPI000490D230|nr:sorbosone dehydrogenase family protein [Sphingomonas sp. URHD0057]
MNRTFLPSLAVFALAACGGPARLPLEAGIGPAPRLPPPEQALIPAIEVAKAKGWPAGLSPTPAPGLKVNAFAGGLDHPRWLYVLANGDVLVAETNGPGTDPGPPGIKGYFFKQFKKKAGSDVPSANRITLLRDADGDGMAEFRSTLLSGLRSPFGMAVIGNELFVANADSLVAVPFTPGMTTATARPRTVATLPSGRNHHWTKSLVASPDGRWLYVGIGSNSNVGENGMAMEQGRASVWQIDPRTGAKRIVAGGLRNPVGLAINPWSGALWAAVNERDEIGSDLVPDYITSVRDGAFYGWPYSYYGQHVDVRVKPPRPDLVARAIPPDYALGPHVAALGLTFSTGQRLGPAFTRGAFVGEHGSWNRKPPSGYKVVFVPFAGAQPTGMPIDVISGFISGGKAFGRPVGVQLGRDGSLLVADDVGNTVWRVSAAA